MKTLYKWTVEDYHRIIESGVLAGKSVELLEGEIVTMSPEKPIHSTCGTAPRAHRRETTGTQSVRAFVESIR